ncbi:N-acetyltransferase [Sphingosinicella sp. BN140058]|uniref:GNAT family N-acetyltransferase n=1 Tax=Sphingosinicella sp. BN140058 TaxID=1892855 RepID=UPI001FB07F46|nr:GNAT family N-acetyltransferase [Sphingosinicella sp. BN140058]
MQRSRFHGGDRTSAGWLAEQIAADPAAALLVWRAGGDRALLGSVWLEPKPAGGWYLGSLTVDPARQDQGLGRALLALAEDWVQAHGGREIEMSVINIRDALIAWYERRGYRCSGETRPFPYGDDRFGVPKRTDLEFVVLRKRLDFE